MCAGGRYVSAQEEVPAPRERLTGGAEFLLNPHSAVRRSSVRAPWASEARQLRNSLIQLRTNCVWLLSLGRLLVIRIFTADVSEHLSEPSREILERFGGQNEDSRVRTRRVWFSLEEESRRGWRCTISETFSRPGFLLWPDCNVWIKKYLIDIFSFFTLETHWWCFPHRARLWGLSSPAEYFSCFYYSRLLG